MPKWRHWRISTRLHLKSSSQCSWQRKTKMQIISDIEQGTAAWHACRIGNPGASGMSNIITSQGKVSASRTKYMYQLAGELITGEKTEPYQSAAMARGHEMEPEARDVFEFGYGPVDQCGLVYPDHTDAYHCSPDGLLRNEPAGLEIKNPSLPVAVEYLVKGKLPSEYKIQVQGSLMVTGLDYWYFMSYYPGLKPLVLKVERDENLVPQIRDAVENFCRDLMDLVER